MVQTARSRDSAASRRPRLTTSTGSGPRRQTLTNASSRAHELDVAKSRPPARNHAACRPAELFRPGGMVRFGARVRRLELYRALPAEEEPSASALLAARAMQLVSPRTRERIAACLEHFALTADAPLEPRTPHRAVSNTRRLPQVEDPNDRLQQTNDATLRLPRAPMDAAGRIRHCHLSPLQVDSTSILRGDPAANRPVAYHAQTRQTASLVHPPPQGRLASTT